MQLHDSVEVRTVCIMDGVSYLWRGFIDGVSLVPRLLSMLQFKRTSSASRRLEVHSRTLLRSGAVQRASYCKARLQINGPQSLDLSRGLSQAADKDAVGVWISLGPSEHGVGSDAPERFE